MTTTTLYQASDLAGRKRRAFLDEAKSHGRAVLRDSDGAALILLPSSVVENLEQARRALAELLALNLLEELPGRRPAEMGSFAWLAALDAEDRSEFVREFQDALALSLSSDDFSVVGDCVADWKRTARALADPTRRAILTGPGGGDFVEVGAPEE